MTATIHVCTGCKDRDPARRGAGEGGGPALYAALSAALADQPGGIALVPQPCLGPCRTGGRIALTAPGRWGWLVEGIATPAQCQALLDFVATWRASADGRVPKADRPALLSRHLLGRLPPAAPTLFPEETTP